VADHLLEDGANIHIYDPKVSEAKIKDDLVYLWELNGIPEARITQKLAQVFAHSEAVEAVTESHAIAILTEWDEFKTYDWASIYEKMYKPAFLFDGRNVLDAAKLKTIGFQYKGIGKG
jgi:UDPglucose 6-dehydrogenase